MFAHIKIPFKKLLLSKKIVVWTFFYIIIIGLIFAGSPVPVPGKQLWIANYEYQAQGEDELSLRKNDLIEVCIVITFF